MKSIILVGLLFLGGTALAKNCQCYSFSGSGASCQAIEDFELQIPWYASCSRACGTAELYSSESEAIEACQEGDYQHNQHDDEAIH